MHRFSVVAVHCIFKTLYIGLMILSCVFGYLNGFPKIECVFALRATTLIGSKKPDWSLIAIWHLQNTMQDTIMFCVSPFMNALHFFWVYLYSNPCCNHRKHYYFATVYALDTCDCHFSDVMHWDNLCLSWMSLEDRCIHLNTICINVSQIAFWIQPIKFYSVNRYNAKAFMKQHSVNLVTHRFEMSVAGQFRCLLSLKWNFTAGCKWD